MVARLLEVQADDVIFTSGATESNALAILGVVRACRNPAARLHVLYAPGAHASIVENVKLLAAEGAEIEPLPMRDRQVDCAALAKLLRPSTALVTMEAVCGETGVIWNTREVASVIREPSRAQRGIMLHVDASQAPLTEKVTRAHFGADLLTLDGSKIGAARGVGALIAHRTIPLAPLYLGGGQERGVRPGSEAPHLAESLAKALSQAAAGRDAFRIAAEAARTDLISRLTAAIPDIYINEGRPGRQVPHILNVSLPGRDTDFLVALLDEAGFAVSTKSACETDSETGSRPVLVLFGDDSRSRSTLRISWSAGRSSRDLSRFADALTRAVAFSAGGVDDRGSG